MSEDILAHDLLHGAKQIAKYLGLPERRTFYYIEKGYIPTSRIGTLIVASKSVLRKHFTEKTER